MSRQVTKWYPGSIKPIRIGMYERRQLHGQYTYIFLSYWNGKKWCRKWDHQASLYQSLRWRGRASPHPDYKEK